MVNASSYTLTTTDQFISVDTTSAQVNLTLPSSPPTGLTYTIADNAYMAATHNIVIQNNSVINHRAGTVTDHVGAVTDVTVVGNVMYVANHLGASELAGSIAMYTGSGTSWTYVSSVQDAHLQEPDGICVVEGYMYVTQTQGGSVVLIYTGSGTSWTYSTSLSSNLSGPLGVLVEGGYMYVCNLSGNSISMYTGSGTSWTYVSSLDIMSPDYLTIVGGYMYVCSMNVNHVTIFSGSGTTWTPTGGISVMQPSGIALQSGYLYVSNYHLSTVTIFSGSGTTWTQVGTFATDSALTEGLAVYGNYLYVSEYIGTAIAVYTPPPLFSITNNGGSLKLTWDGNKWLSTV